MLMRILSVGSLLSAFAFSAVIDARPASAAPGCPLDDVAFASTVIFPWDTWICYGFTGQDGMRDYCQRPVLQPWSCDRRPGNPNDRVTIACDESGYCGPEVPIPCNGPGSPCG